VRIEEIINYFDYGYAKPTDGKPFAVHTETVDSPFRSGAKLIRIGIQAKEVSQAALPPANLVFLVDVSGSMYSRDKLPMVKYTLCTLAHQTRAQDRITLVTYADGNKVVLPPTTGNQRQKILAALDSLKAGGSTAGENAIQQAYQAAQRAYIRNGINRILLATDGDFNVGITDFNTLRSMVAEKRKSGISLTTLGFGSGNYNERLMEQLADAGDGNYSYIDSPEEAQKVLHRQLSSTLATVAQDVKIQVEFNPATVKEYRLIGYENRMLAREDFNNDQVDAGDIGAGHNVTALYEIIPAGETGWLPESRYQAAPAANDKAGSEYAFINLRYKLPGQSSSILINRPVATGSKPLAQGSNATRQAVAAAVAMGIDPAAAAKAVSSVTEVAGRYSVHDVNGRSARLMLAKNPAGWQEAMTMVDPRVDQVVIGVNGQVPDGQDLSWLWDVDFSGVNQPGRRVIACGERGADLAVRLEYAGIHCDLVDLPMDALAACEPGRVEVLLNYTAMRDFKVLLDRKEGKR